MNKYLIGFNAFLILIASFMTNQDIKTYLSEHFHQPYLFLTVVGLFGNVFIFLYPHIFKQKDELKASLEIMSADFIEDFKEQRFSMHVQLWKSNF